MDRKTRHDIKHDKFLDEIGNAYEVVNTHRRTLTMAVAGLAVIVAIAFAFSLYRGSQEEKAQVLLADALQTMSAPVGPGATGDEAYETEAERAAAAKTKFQGVVEEYGSSDAAEIAELNLATIAAIEGDAELALEGFREFARNHEDNILGVVAEWSVYNLRITNGETEQVISELETQVDDPNARKLPLPTVLAMLARAHEINGNSEEANKNWRRITTEFNDSPYALEANRKLVQG